MTNPSYRAIAVVIAVSAFAPSVLLAQPVSYRPPSTIKLVQHLIEHPTGALAVRKLTLEEAQQIALKNNKSLTLARLNILEKNYAVKSARTDYFPKLLGNITYFHFDRPLGEVAVTATGKAGLLPAGTPLASANVINQNASLSTIFVGQPITKLIAVNAAVQMAKADEFAAQAQMEKGERDIASGVAQLYHGLVGTKRIQTALETQIKVLEQVLAARPLPQLRVALVESKQGLVQAKSSVDDLTTQLLALLDLPSCTILELDDPLPPALSVKCADDAARLASHNSPEVWEAQQSITKAEQALRVAKMDFLPDVNVVGGWANQNAASYIQDNIGYAGVTVNYMFWGWGKRKQVWHQRQTMIDMAHQNLAVTQDKVEVAARQAYIQYQQAAEIYQLATEMVDARKAVEKGAVGAALAEARGETVKAELEQMKADISYRIAHAKLSAAIGTK